MTSRALKKTKTRRVYGCARLREQGRGSWTDPFGRHKKLGQVTFWGQLAWSSWFEVARTMLPWSFVPLLPARKRSPAAWVAERSPRKTDPLSSSQR